jgi:hypothetical protein
MNDTWMLMVMTIPLVAIIGGLINAGLALHHRARIKELAIRERIAMIERGLKPPPELDPGAFERECCEGEARASAGATSAKHRTAGVILTGIGLGLMLLISLASDDTAVGVGVGGGIAILGVAFLVNSVLGARADRQTAGRSYQRPGPGRRDGADVDTGAPDLP